MIDTKFTRDNVRRIALELESVVSITNMTFDEASRKLSITLSNGTVKSVIISDTVITPPTPQQVGFVLTANANGGYTWVDPKATTTP